MDLLIELGCEELPPKSLPTLGKALLAGLTARLDKAQLEYAVEASRVYYTPRRLSLLIAEVAAQQPDQIVERKGPAVRVAFADNNEPTPAALGFAKSVGKDITELETLKTDGGEWLFYRLEKKGRQLRDLLFPLLEEVLAGLPVAKPMRWAANNFSFIRPVHWLIVLHGANMLEGCLFGLQAGNLTWGHRIHSPGPHKINSTDDYEQLLNSAHIIADQDQRKTLIRQQVNRLGKVGGGKALVEEALLEEVTNLVEWPRSVGGNFDSAFLDIPAEALIASMQVHQKCFPVLDANTGALLPRFIAVANLESKNTKAVQKGFERVIRPRLADARFFWEQDNKKPIEDWLPRLDTLVFQKMLGSVGDKSARIATISKTIAEETGFDDAAAQKAGSLCKCDLVSQMVGEFPELQGVMGGYYARRSGASNDVAQAVAEHYLPRHSGDQLPDNTLGKIVSLADRVDTLTGIFATGHKPSGNKDPFALRRAALGLIRILLDSELDIELDALLKISTLSMNQQQAVSADALADLRAFILERLKHYLRDQGHSTGLVNAVLDAPLSSLPDLAARLDALNGFMAHENATSLVAANKRIGNILRKSGQNTFNDIDEDILIIEEERHVFAEISTITVKLDRLYNQANYVAALSLLASLAPSIEAFFEQVMVLDDDPKIRQNRLNLLTKLKGLFARVANLALLG